MARRLAKVAPDGWYTLASRYLDPAHPDPDALTCARNRLVGRCLRPCYLYLVTDPEDGRDTYVQQSDKDY